MFSSPSYHDEGYTHEKISSVINKTTWKHSKEKVICYHFEYCTWGGFTFWNLTPRFKLFYFKCIANIGYRSPLLLIISIWSALKNNINRFLLQKGKNINPGDFRRHFVLVLSDCYTEVWMQIPPLAHKRYLMSLPLYRALYEPRAHKKRVDFLLTWLKAAGEN